MKTYHKKGQALGAVSAIITLVIGVTVATLVMILGGALGGQTYNLVEPDIDNISDAAIKASIKSGITSAFEAQAQTGDYMPLIVLGVVIFIILSLVLGFLAFGGFSGGRQGVAL